MSSKQIQLQQGTGSFEAIATSAHTVADLLNEKGISGNVAVSIGGSTVESSTTLRQGDVVSIVTTNKRGG